MPILHSRRCARARVGAWLPYLCVALALAGCLDPIEHDEIQAARKAQEFVEVAFVKNDGARAYGLLAPATKRYVSLEQFKHVLARMHPQGSPKNARALESEPMKGEKAIYIYLAGENSGEHFYYRITLEGTKASEYRVLKFERSNQPFLPAPDRKKIAW